MSQRRLPPLPWWRRLSLSLKLRLSIAGYSLLVLIIVSSTLAWFVNSYFHQKEQQDLQMLAEVLADNSRAAVTFNDPKSAENVLTAAKGNPHIVMAVLIQDRKVFASYPPSLHADDFELPPAGRRIWLGEEHYHASVPLVVGKEVQGWLYLKSDLREWQVVKRRLYAVFLGLLAGLLALTLVISYWLNRHITRPLGELSQWATQVSKAKDFNARAVKHNEDEVGYLVDSLNLMLAELAKQESIVSWNEVLEKEIQVRKEVENDLIRLRNKADMANKAKSQFLANMSHELRTPLNAIIGYSEMLQEIVDEDEVDREEINGDIGKIHSAGKHLLSLINDVLDISKIEAGKIELNIEEFNGDELIEDVIGTIRPLAESRKNKLKVNVDCKLGIMYSDSTKVRQILLNLLSNAVKFTHHGSVELTCSKQEQPGGGFITFNVKDSGIGISAAHLDSIFQPFSQADASTTRKYGGTGLGLAISNSFVEMLGGSIKVDSQVGQGTVFTVTLPLHTAEAMNSSRFNTIDSNYRSNTGHLLTTERTEPKQKVQGTRLLIVDDEDVVHSMLRHQLAHLDYRVTSARSGTDGLKHALTEQFDVILLDIFMKDLDGWQVLQTLKADSRTAHTPVILYSIASEQDKGYALGASDYLVKPVNRENLIRVLKRHHKPSSVHEVLLIGADPSTACDIAGSLRDTGFQLVQCQAANQALDYLARDATRIILIDLQVGDVNGFDFIQAVHAAAEFEHLPIIILSDRDYSAEERNLLQKHALKVLRKGSYDRQEFIRALQNVLMNQVEVRVT